MPLRFFCLAGYLLKSLRCHVILVVSQGWIVKSRKGDCGESMERYLACRDGAPFDCFAVAFYGLCSVLVNASAGRLCNLCASAVLQHCKAQMGGIDPRDFNSGTCRLGDFSVLHIGGMERCRLIGTADGLCVTAAWVYCSMDWLHIYEKAGEGLR